ncbi:MAG: redoxin domain-containing protein [Candidatus Poribacteria bacterium]|nr:redoxin domain-containing protein [Candidatus Poribacteria bacterium]
MAHKIVIFLLIFSLPIAVHAQVDYTIPKKHRVIQEKSPQSSSVLIDAKVSDISFTTLHGNTHTLSVLLQQGPVVFMFLSTECPVAQRYTMRLKRMNAEFAEKHVTIVGVYSNENDSVDDVKAYMTRAEFPFPIVKDTDGGLARRLGATMTPQAHLIDSHGVLRYRGSIDDNRYETRIKHYYLKDALVAILDGKLVPVKETAAFGCTIHLPDLPTEKQITYTKHIVPILQKNCLTCHHQDGIAPFTLANYNDVKRHSAKIVEQTQAHLMPPWRLGQGYGKFKNELRLTDTEIEMIANWVNADTPAGPKLNDLPAALSSETSILREPAIIEIPIEFKALSAEGKHASLTITIKTDFGRDEYVRGFDFQSKNTKTTRRVTTYLKTQRNVTPDGNQFNAQTNPNHAVDVRLGTWAPGFTPALLPEGVGYLLPKGSQIMLNVLYKGSDRQEQDTLRVEFYLSKKPKTARLHKVTLMDSDDANQQKDNLSHQFNQDVYVFAVHPPTYVDKQGMRVVAKTPTDEHIKMLWVKESHIEWLNEWFDIYRYSEPIFLPAGSRLEFDMQKDSENQNKRELSDENTVCHFFYVLASEYNPD